MVGKSDWDTCEQKPNCGAEGTLVSVLMIYFPCFYMMILAYLSSA